LIGAVLLAPPRAPFPLGRDAFALFQMLGREVAMFVPSAAPPSIWPSRRSCRITPAASPFVAA
jgi:hypothetical protein